MEKRTSRYVLIVALMMASFTACERNEVVVDTTRFNTPSYAIAANAFSYSISAQRLSLTQTFPLAFTANRLFIAAAASNVSQGQAIFTLFDQSNAVVRSDTFKLPGMYQVITVGGTPASMVITFQNFTGSIQYAVAGDTMAVGVSDFPNTRGSRWTYTRYDSLVSRRDTVVVTILGEVTIENRRMSAWQRASRMRTDTTYVRVTGDTVRVYDFPFSPSTNSKYILPLQVGKGWRGDLMYDSSTVRINGFVSTPAGQFTNAFLVEQNWSTFNDYGHFDTWLVPRVGIVKQYRKQWGFGFQNELWELLSYHINTGSE